MGAPHPSGCASETLPVLIANLQEMVQVPGTHADLHRTPSVIMITIFAHGQLVDEWI